MCCDWFDMFMGIAGGFVLGCVVTGLLAKMIMLEQAKGERNEEDEEESKSKVSTP